MTVNINDLLASLDMIWMGMLGLFAVCIFIMLFTMLLKKMLMPKEKKDG